MKNKSYYDLLDIDKNASQEEIKKAFRTLSRKYHPDLNPDDQGAEEKFKEINEAYSCLSDKYKKQHYDFVNRNSGPAKNLNIDDVEELFKGFGFDYNSFSGFAERSKKRREQTYSDNSIIELQVPFGSMKTGCAHRFNIMSTIDCEKCNGIGGETSYPCGICNGAGMITETITQHNMVLTRSRPCLQCKNSGVIVENPCDKCNATGMIRQQETYEVHIKANKIEQ